MPKGKGPDEPGKLTSEDIFGDLIDDLVPAVPTPPPAKPAPDARKGPIKVKVSEPGAPAPDREVPRRVPPRPRPPVRELLPEDVAALLDAFSEPGEAATRAEARPAEPEPSAPAAARVEPAVPEDEVVIDIDHASADALAVLEADAEALTSENRFDETPAESEPLPPPPPPVSRHAEPGTDEGLKDLMSLMRMPRGRAHRMGGGPNKFRASAPVADAATQSLDLAAVAEEALSGSSPRAAAPAAAAPAASGTTYGPYRLLQRIAVGGMAEVFRAKRSGVEGFEKVVAVKRILSHLSDNKEFVDMFIDEAKMVAGLTHPNIVQIFDLGKIDKTYFIAMEYVHGRDLRSIMRRARERGLRMPLDLALLIVSKVCSALEFAHRKKDERGRPMLIVHRDVSPQNILISFEGEVKLTDFGIAKAATKATITDAGALRGKLLYMSPEQAWGRPMDRRSDVFSLGIVFYEAVTDQKPFASNSEMSILEMVRESRVIPPSQVNPRIPPRLEKVLMKALAREVDERYQDAAEMYKDLERALHERTPPTAGELARFMEVLFDENERSEAPAEAGAASPLLAGTPSEEVHVEFDTGPPAEPAGAAVETAAATRDPMSIQKLLKRFGIK